MNHSAKNYIELSTKEENDDDSSELVNDNMMSNNSINTKTNKKLKIFAEAQESNFSTKKRKNVLKVEEKEEEENDEMINDEFDDFNIDKTFNEETLNFKLKTPYYDKEERELKNRDGFYYFKLTLSLLFTLVYIFGFLYNFPLKKIKVGKLEDLKNLINKVNINTRGILITNLNNAFDFYLESNIGNSFYKNRNLYNLEDEKNGENNNNNSNKVTENYKLKGYLLEERFDDTFIFKWMIGLIYFTCRNYLFIHSNDVYTGNFISKNRISIIQNLTSFLFPLYLFYYSKRYSASKMIKIKEDNIDPNLSFYIESEKNLSFFAIFDVLFPMIHFFITSMIFNQFEQGLGKFFNRLKIRMKKN